MLSLWPVEAKLGLVAKAVVCVRYGMAGGKQKPCSTWEGWVGRVVVSAMMQVLDYWQILLLFPSSGLCWCGLVISASWLSLSSVGYESPRLSLQHNLRSSDKSALEVLICCFSC